MKDFDKWDKEFREQNLYAFNNNESGLLWLKVRAICRGKQIRQFIEDNNIKLNSRKLSEQNIELYDILTKRKDAMRILDEFLQCMNHEWYTEMGVNIEALKNDLYKVMYYSWGGDQNNSLDRHLIKRYVKIISDFSELQRKQTEIWTNAWNYVQNSWYNNWTSFIIESLFKRNPKVVSAVGEIKSVDFFIDNCPLDLKVTFFPVQFMEQKVKGILGKCTLSWLKAKCKGLDISFDKNATTTQQIYTITEKLEEIGRTDITEELAGARRKVIDEAQANPGELMKWLYENQGEMRFGAENRIYFILADSKNLDESWKMKRAFSLIEPKVTNYIEDFSSSSLSTVKFVYKKKQYTALADIVFVIK